MRFKDATVLLLLGLLLCRPMVAALSMPSSSQRTARRKQGQLDLLPTCTSGTQARRLLLDALEQPDTRLFDSVRIPAGASSRGVSDGDLAIQTRFVNKKYSIMEVMELSGNRDADRASVALLSVFGASTVAALGANQNLPGPEIVRFLVVWLFTFAPLALVGYGIKDAEQLQTVLVRVQREVFPRYRQRMLQHEAGHYLMGHLLGLPIQGYRANAVKNAVSFYPLADQDTGKAFASQLGFDRPMREDSEPDIVEVMTSEAPYYSKEGRGSGTMEQQSVFRKSKNYTDNPFLKLPSQNEPSNAWPYRGFDEETLDKLAVVSVAGVCAEILAFGDAEGGVADLSQLRQIFNSANEEIPEREVENRIRFALGFTMSQLRRHLGALDALVDAMERDASVNECVVAIEQCENVSGQDGIMGDYELRRRETLRSEGANLLEQFFLGNEKNIDTVEDRYVEGKGGGSRKQKLQLTGDDPLYLALAVASVFLAWASSGGLTLH